MKDLKYLLLAGLFLSSCSDSPQGPIEQLRARRASVRMIEQYCPECGGTGKVKPSIGYKAFIGVVTLGCGLMIEHVDCDMCGGDGVIQVRALRTDSVVE